MGKARTFISFAAEDARIRDLFVGQGRLPATPWEIVDLSLHEPFSDSWKTRTRPRIKGCDVVLQLVGMNTYRADGAIWEVECAKQEGVASFGVWISKTERGPIPSCFASNNVIDWTWEGVDNMIQQALATGRR
jgi:hypothetical protein